MCTASRAPASSWAALIWHIIIAVVAAEVFEAICVLMRGRSVGTALGDLSAMLTAVIFAVAVPPYLPWYLVVGGMFFGIVVVKHTFGGLGQNTFNPAMAAYVLLLVSFPGQMTAWIAPSPENFEKLGFSESLEVISPWFCTEARWGASGKLRRRALPRRQEQ